MRILISHSSAEVQGHLQSLLRSSIGGVKGIARNTLTETYNMAEHHDPDCVIISAAFAEAAEFELLATLFRLMHIGCVVVGPDNSTGFQHSDLPVVSESCDAKTLIDAISKAIMQMDRPKQVPTAPPVVSKVAFDSKKIILIGASTGGVDALCRVLQHFSPASPPALIVQHTGGGFAASLIRLLNGATKADVHEATQGARLAPGNIYLAPNGNAHLTLAGRQSPRTELREGPPISGHRPSIDALFRSALPQSADVVAALLTGMGRDGATGLTALRKAGAHTIGQDEKTSVVYGMPRVAFEMGGVAQQLPLDAIGPALLRACQKTVRA